MEHGRTLYSLLQSSLGSSKRSLGRLLEQVPFLSQHDATHKQAHSHVCVFVCALLLRTYRWIVYAFFHFFVFLSLFVPDVIFFQSFLFKLYQELCSYKESHLNLRFCIRMRTKIIDILLEDIYNTEESNLEKSRILIEKAKVLRAHGLERVKECMQCLEAAISTLVSPV